MRFVLLVLVLLATAALVTVAMFETLYLVMGCSRAAMLLVEELAVRGGPAAQTRPRPPLDNTNNAVVDGQAHEGGVHGGRLSTGDPAFHDDFYACRGASRFYPGPARRGVVERCL